MIHSLPLQFSPEQVALAPNNCEYFVLLRCVSHVCPTENGLNLSVSPMYSPDNYDFFITLPMIGYLLAT